MLTSIINKKKLKRLLIFFQIGSLAGNLMIKHQHNFFSSDIFLLLETVGGQVTIRTYFQQYLLIDKLFTEYVLTKHKLNYFNFLTLTQS